MFLIYRNVSEPTKGGRTTNNSAEIEAATTAIELAINAGEHQDLCSLFISIHEFKVTPCLLNLLNVQIVMM